VHISIKSTDYSEGLKFIIIFQLLKHKFIFEFICIFYRYIFKYIKREREKYDAYILSATKKIFAFNR